MPDLQPIKRSFATIADDLATWMETIEMLELQIAAAPISDERSIMCEERDELKAGVDRLAGELATKADGVVAVLKRFKAEAHLIADEEMRLTARRLRLEKTREWLEAYVIDTLDRFNTPFLKTPTATIRIQNNGGVAPLQTDNLALAKQWFDVTVKMPVDLYMTIGPRLTLSEISQIKQTNLEPANQRIRTALAERCESCAGAGKVKVSSGADAGGEIPCEDACWDCEGTGTRHIQGAKLERRGRHLRIS
jgi:hypothetical protein